MPLSISDLPPEPVTGSARSERLVFGETVEALVNRALKGHLTPELKGQLLVAGLDVDAPFLASYAWATWVKVLRISVDALYPLLPKDRAYFQLGEVVFQGFTETLMGRIATKAMYLLGPERTLAQIQRQFRGANNYTDSRTTRIAERTFDIWLNETSGNANFPAGVIFGGISASGAKNLKVVASPIDAHAATIRVSWGQATSEGDQEPVK